MAKLKPNFTILAIETSLDDTCAAVTCDDRVLSNVVASQVRFHEEFGGTVPHIAKRKHVEWLDKTIEEALIRSRISPQAQHRSGILRGSSTPPIPLCVKEGGYRPHPNPLLVKEREREEGGSYVNAVAVTYGPGLAPCLEVGIAKAKELARRWDKPLVAVNHMEGHLLSVLAKNSQGKGGLSIKQPPPTPPYKGGEKCVELPVLGFLISGGHTQLVLIRAIGKYELLGETLDDAAGEAYDKVARMLNLGYPGGPILSELAKKGLPIYNLPEPMKHRKDLNFSFSGLKTAAMYKLRQMSNDTPGESRGWRLGKLPESHLIGSETLPGSYFGSGVTNTRKFAADFAASFQQAVINMLVRRLKRAIEIYKPKSIWLGGGVISNVTLRNEVRKTARQQSIPVYIPYSKKLYTDNAAMIGVAAWYKARRGGLWEDIESLDRKPSLSF